MPMHAGEKNDQCIFKIGSCNTGKINYGMKDHFFHLDEKLLKIKLGVNETINPDILNLRKIRWNSSSSIAPPPRADQEKHLFNIRAGFADFKIAPLTRKASYQGCELRDNFKGKYITI